MSFTAPAMLVEPEEGLGGEIGLGDVGDRLLAPVRDQHDVGRVAEHRKLRHALGQPGGDTGLGQLGFACRDDGGALLRHCAVQRRCHLRDAVAVMRDDRLQALLEIDVAQEPDEAVEQQVFTSA